MAEFKTRFVNKSADWRRIPECVVIRNGMKTFIPDLAPAGESGDTYILVGDDPYSLYAPYSRVVFFDHKIEAVLRKGWNNVSPFKNKERIVEFELEATSTQSYALFPEPGEPSIILIPGIKRWLQVSLLSPYIGYKRIFVRQIKVKGLEQFKFIELREKRPKQELKRIEKERKALLSKHGENAVLSRYVDLGF